MMDRENSPSDAAHNTRPELSALQVGGMCGASGLLYGGVSGVWQASHPVIKSLSVGIHWFAFGTSYWALRSFILKERFDNKASPSQKAYVSALSGGLAGGAVNWAVNRRFVPGIVIFSLLGYVGQRSYTAVDAWRANEQAKPSKPLSQQLSESKWVPFRMLSDEQYKEMLSEKLLSVEAEIALIDDKIQRLQEVQAAERRDEV